MSMQAMCGLDTVTRQTWRRATQAATNNALYEKRHTANICDEPTYVIINNEHETAYQ